MVKKTDLRVGCSVVMKEKVVGSRLFIAQTRKLAVMHNIFHLKKKNKNKIKYEVYNCHNKNDNDDVM